MISFLLGVLVGICIGVGGTFLILFIRARALVKGIMQNLNNPQEEKPQKE